MNIISLLPEDVLRAILHEWIEPQWTLSLSAMDIAMCHRLSREKYLLCLKGKRLSLSSFHGFCSPANWARSREIKLLKILLSFVSSKHEMMELIWQQPNPLTDISVQLSLNQSFSLGKLFSYATFMKHLKLIGHGKIVNGSKLDQPIALEYLLLDIERTTFSDFHKFLQRLGSYASHLCKLDLISGNYQDFYLVLRSLPHLTDFHFAKMSKDCDDDSDDYSDSPDISSIFPNSQENSAYEVICPALRKLSVKTYRMDILVTPVLSKFTRLEGLYLVQNWFDRYDDSDVFQYSAAFQQALCSIFLSLETFYLGDIFVEKLENVVRVLPTSVRLKHLTISQRTFPDRELIVQKFPSLESLTFLNYICHVLCLPGDLLPNVLMHSLKSLKLDGIYICGESFSNFFRYGGEHLPSLQSLTIQFVRMHLTHCYDRLLEELLLSSLAERLVTIDYGTCRGYVGYEIQQLTTIPAPIPGKLAQLNTLIFRNFIIYPMETLFIMAPKLENLRFRSCCLESTFFCSSKFRHARNLKRLEAPVEATLQPQDSWYDIIHSCPSLKELLLHTAEGNYWNKRNGARWTIMNTFKNKIQFSQSTVEDSIFWVNSYGETYESQRRMDY